MGKYGDEGNQLIFKILKRGEHEATGQADLALRYDLTVPLARVVAQYQSRLPRLFKRYQIQPVWRADRPARGRFREFYQCDVDALGSTSPVVEAELCAAVSDALTELGFDDFVHSPESPSAAHGAARRGGCCSRPARLGAGGARQTRQDRSGRRRTRARPNAGSIPPRRPRSCRCSRRARRKAIWSASPDLSATIPWAALHWRTSRRSARSPPERARRAGSVSTSAWRAGCPTTRAPSWRSRLPTLPAALAAAGATTTWSGCSSGSTSPPAAFRWGWSGSSSS